MRFILFLGLSCTPAKHQCKPVLDALLCCQEGESLIVHKSDSGMDYYGCTKEGK